MRHFLCWILTGNMVVFTRGTEVTNTIETNVRYTLDLKEPECQEEEEKQRARPPLSQSINMNSTGSKFHFFYVAS